MSGTEARVDSASGDAAASRGMKVEAGAGPSYMMVLPWDLDAPGGVNQVVLGLGRELQRRGTLHPIFLILDWTYRRPTQDGRNRSIVRLRLREPADPLKDTWAFAKWAVSQPLGLVRLRSLLYRYRVAVINVHYPTPSAVTFALLKSLRLCPARLVVSFHGQDVVSCAQLRGLPGRLFRFLLSSADAVTACSQGLAGKIRSAFPSECREIQVVHNGVDPASIENEIAHADPAAARFLAPYALCVSGFVGKKALEVLVEAFKSVRSVRPDLDLVIAGRAGPELPRIERALASAGLDRHVTLLVDASHADVTRLMRGASIFILPSRDEPFGIVLLEAGLAGLPVVATNVGGVPEIIVSPEYGILVAPDDPSALASAVLMLMADPACARAIGQNLRDRVLACFSAAATADGYLKAAFDGLLDRDRPWQTP